MLMMVILVMMVIVVVHRYAQMHRTAAAAKQQTLLPHCHLKPRCVAFSSRNVTLIVMTLLVVHAITCNDTCSIVGVLYYASDASSCVHFHMHDSAE